MRRYSFLTEEDKIFIISNYEKLSLGRISEILNKNRVTIFYFYKRWIDRKSIINKKHTGRKKKLSNRDIKKLEKYVERNPLLDRKQIKEKLNFNCSLQTLSTYLRKSGFRNLNYKKRPKFSAINKIKRREFAQKYVNWTVRQWSKVIFSDETSIEIYKKYPQKIWRKPGWGLKEGFYLPSKLQFGKKYLKAWSIVTYNGVGKLVFTEGRWSAKTYTDILSKNLKQNATKLVGNDFLFQEDGDTAHTSNLATKWKQENNISSMEWPPESCDMNIIGKNSY